MLHYLEINYRFKWLSIIFNFTFVVLFSTGLLRSEIISTFRSNKYYYSSITTAGSSDKFIAYSQNPAFFRVIDIDGNILKNISDNKIIGFPPCLNEDGSKIIYMSNSNTSILLNRVAINTVNNTSLILENANRNMNFTYSEYSHNIFGTDNLKNIFCWDSETGKQLFSLDSSAGFWANSVYTSKYSNKIALIQNDKFIVYDVDSGKTINIVPASTSQRTTAYFHKNDSLISVSSGLGYLQTFNYYTGELLYYYYCPADNPLFFHNDSLLASINQILEVKTGKIINDFGNICANPLCTNILEANGKTYVILGSTNLYIHCLETDSTVKVFDFEGLENTDFLSDWGFLGWSGNSLFISDYDKSNLKVNTMKINTVKQYLRNVGLFAGYNKDTLILYNPEVNDYFVRFSTLSNLVDVRFSDNLEYCSYRDVDGKHTLMTWNDKKVISTDTTGAIFAYYFSPDENYAFSYYYDNAGNLKIKIIEPKTGNLIKEIPLKYSQGAEFTPDGQYLVVSKGVDKKFVYYKAPSFDSTGYIDRKSNWHDYPLVFSKDGKYLLLSTNDGKIDFYNLDSSLVSFSVGGYFNGIDNYSLSDDETKLLIMYSEGTIILYDINGLLNVPNTTNQVENTFVYPNPAENYIEIPYSGNLYSPAKVNVYSSTGNAYSLPVVTSIDGKFKLSVADLPAGSYYLPLPGSKAITNAKFIIVR